MNLVMWGPSSSGKTIFLAQLFVRVKPEGSDWRVRPTDQSVVSHIETLAWRMRSEGAFPAPTTTANAQDMGFRLVQISTDRSAEVAIKDRAGALSERLDESSYELIRRADGLLLMFDHTREQNRLLHEVQMTLLKLSTDRATHTGDRNEHRDPRPIAVCLSKADLLIETPDDLKRAREEPDAFVRRHLPPSVIDCVDDHCARTRFFPVSSVGVRVTSGIVEPVLYLDEALEIRIAYLAEPINLLEPFAWLFEQVHQREAEPL
jgi:hypothetical protein